MLSGPTNPRGVIDLRIILPGKTPTNVQNWLNDAVSAGTDNFRRLMANVVSGTSVGFGGVGLVARARGVTTPSASSSFTCTAASATAGDKLILLGPAGPVTLTCVAANTENPALGQYSVGGGTDSNLATSIRTAFASYPPAQQYATAGGSTNTVALTSVLDGTLGNSIKLVKQVTTSGVFSFSSNTAFTGGIGLDTSKTITVTIGTNPVANDTLRFGNVLFTWKASATTENEITIGANASASGDNLVAAIAAHSILGGIGISGSNSSGTVTVTATYPDLLHYLLYIASSTGSVTVSGQIQPASMTFTANSAYAATSGVF